MSTQKDTDARIALLQGTPPTTNRKARFYTLTKQGRKQLVAETKPWRRFAAAIAGILGPEEA